MLQLNHPIEYYLHLIFFGIFLDNEHLESGLFLEIHHIWSYQLFLLQLEEEGMYLLLTNCNFQFFQFFPFLFQFFQLTTHLHMILLIFIQLKLQEDHYYSYLMVYYEVQVSLIYLFQNYQVNVQYLKAKQKSSFFQLNCYNSLISFFHHLLLCFRRLYQLHFCLFVFKIIWDWQMIWTYFIFWQELVLKMVMSNCLNFFQMIKFTILKNP